MNIFRLFQCTEEIGNVEAGADVQGHSHFLAQAHSKQVGR